MNEIPFLVNLLNILSLFLPSEFPLTAFRLLIKEFGFCVLIQTYIYVSLPGSNALYLFNVFLWGMSLDNIHIFKK